MWLQTNQPQFPQPSIWSVGFWPSHCPRWGLSASSACDSGRTPHWSQPCSSHSSTWFWVSCSSSDSDSRKLLIGRGLSATPAQNSNQGRPQNPLSSNRRLPVARSQAQGASSHSQPDESISKDYDSILNPILKKGFLQSLNASPSIAAATTTTGTHFLREAGEPSLLLGRQRQPRWNAMKQWSCWKSSVKASAHSALQPFAVLTYSNSALLKAHCSIWQCTSTPDKTHLPRCQPRQIITQFIFGHGGLGVSYNI